MRACERVFSIALPECFRLRSGHADGAFPAPVAGNAFSQFRGDLFMLAGRLLNGLEKAGHVIGPEEEAVPDWGAPRETEGGQGGSGRSHERVVLHSLTSERRQAMAGGDDLEQCRLAAAIVADQKGDRCVEIYPAEGLEQRQAEGVSFAGLEQREATEQRPSSVCSLVGFVSAARRASNSSPYAVYSFSTSIAVNS